MDCGSWSVVGHQEDGSTIVHPLYCRRWRCPRCSQVQKRRLLRRLQGVKAHTFMTLTCNPRAYQSVPQAFTGMSLAVNQLMKRIRRKWPHLEVEYFMVWELTKAGWPHAHLMLRAPFIPQRWLSTAWNDLTGAPVVDIRPVHSNEHLCSYLVKYLTKNPRVPHGMKHYRFSKHFLDAVAPQPEPGSLRVTDWTLSRLSPQELAHEFSAAGHTVQERPDGSYICAPRGSPSAPLYDSMSLHPELQEVRS